MAALADRSLIAQRRRSGNVAFRLPDTSSMRVPASFLLRGAAPRDVSGHLAHLVSQFVETNQTVLRSLQVDAEPHFDRGRAEILFRSRSIIGGVPLRSPLTGRFDYVLVVTPRFAWRGIGLMLSETGWRITPSILPLPMLPSSERSVPPWVLAAIVLVRINEMLPHLRRHFEMIEEVRSSPRGAVNWSTYATRSLPKARALEVPCRFPDLRQDTQLKATIHFALRKQLDSLESQRAAGPHVRSLIARCMQLLVLVGDQPPKQPSAVDFDRWLRGTVDVPAFTRGIEAVQWTTEERGLAGLSTLAGLPWSLSMEAFFESWVETVLTRVASRVGGHVRSARKRETITPLRWEPPYVGSQRYLLPDVLLERDDLTVIVDAKYKSHWEEMHDKKWYEVEEEMKERHRADLLQVLAYANLSRTPRTVVCLAYPCEMATWMSMIQRKQLFHRATLQDAANPVELRLTALPMGVPIEEAARPLIEEISKV